MSLFVHTLVFFQFDDLNLVHHKSYETELLDWGGTLSCTGSQGNAIIYGKTASDSKPVIHVYNKQGEFQHSLLPPGCEHGGGYRYGIMEVKMSQQPYIAMSCLRCKELCLKTACEIATESDCIDKMLRTIVNAPGQMCHGRKGQFLVVNMTRGSKSLSILDYSFNLTKHVQIDMDLPLHICYANSEDHGEMVIKSDSDLHMVSATSLETGTTIWREQGVVRNQMCDPHGLCTDGKDRIFIADGQNSRILIINAEDGTLIKCVTVPSLGFIKDVAWCKEEPHLQIRHLANSNANWSISYYLVTSD